MWMLVALVVGLVIWVVGFSITGTPHGNFDYFLPTPILLLIAYVGTKVGPYVRDLLKP